MYWMRLQPDLRLSVVTALAKALDLQPGAFLEMILREQRLAHPKKKRPRKRGTTRS
jgi:hypothetical protein